MDRARTEAAADARRRAETYAEALGARVGTIVQISDTETPYRSDRLRGVALSGSAASGAADLDVSAGELDVDAEVNVTFALDQG